MSKTTKRKRTLDEIAHDENMTLEDRDRVLQATRDAWQDAGEIEIDDNAKISSSDGGVYVQAWVWMSDEDLEIRSGEGS